jgi:phosphatidylinositol alpha-1,6-mannosyltransferase
VAERLIELLADPDRARAMGAAGREWVQQRWTWDHAGQRLRAILAGDAQL